MKFKLAATAALVALGLPTASSADDGLKYQDLIHCAATSLVVAQVLDSKDGENKATVDKMNDQAAALMAIASIGGKKETDVVIADTKQEKSVVIGVLGDSSKSDDFIKNEVPKCKTMGEAAVEVINEKKGK